MSRLEVPLQLRRVRATGDTVLWADLVLSLKTDRGAWQELPFRVDSGTEMTTMLRRQAGRALAPWRVGGGELRVARCEDRSSTEGGT